MSFSLNAFTRGFAAYIAGIPSVTFTEFGLNVPVLGGTGGYSSSETWVITPDENPEINTLSSLRHTAGANDRITKLTIAWSLTAEELLADKNAISLIGIYANDANKTLIASTEFRSEKVEGKSFGSVDVDIPLIEGVEYFIGVAPNGWTNWPEFNPDVGGSTVYQQAANGVQEDLGALTSRTSSWMIPCYATVESTTKVETDTYVARLDGISQYWELSEPIPAPIGTAIELKVYDITSKNSNSILSADGGGTAGFPDSSGGDTLAYRRSGQIRAEIAVDDGAFEDTPIFPFDSLGMHTVKYITTGSNMVVNFIGADVPNNRGYINGVVMSFKLTTPQGVVYEIPLTNKDQGATQLATVGSVNAFMPNYSSDVWEVL